MENQHFDPLEEYLSMLSPEELEEFWANEERLQELEELEASARLESDWRYSKKSCGYDYESGY